MPCSLHGFHMSRRAVLRGMGAAGLAASAPTLAAARLFPEGGFAEAVLAAFDGAGGAAEGEVGALCKYRPCSTSRIVPVLRRAGGVGLHAIAATSCHRGFTEGEHRGTAGQFADAG